MARDTSPGEERRETSGEKSTVNRRKYLEHVCTSAAVLGGLSMGANSATAAGDGPVNTDNWTLAFEDTFDSGSLDTNNWEIGYGWGTTSQASAETITADSVYIQDGQLHLNGTHDGQEVSAGAVNTRDKVTFGPGSYVEARLKNPLRVGFLPAFWAKPNSGAWPPEIDIMELFMTGDSAEDDVYSANFNVHYSTSTEPGDGSTHEMLPTHRSTSENLTTGFHRFGCAWFEDRIEWYFEGQKVGECTDQTAITALNKGAPFYLMLNIGVDSIGNVDYSEPWGEELVVDWVRLWEQGSSSSGGDTTSGSGSNDGSSSDGTEHYFWVRSADGSPAEYAFEASGGNIYPDANNSGDEWIAGDGQTAGGTVTSDDVNGDGFFFTGDIADLWYSGPLEVYIDSSSVDPESLVDSSSAGPKPQTGAAPTVEKFTVSKSEQLGDDRWFSVNWAVGDADGDLDTVEVVVQNGASDVNFAVEDASGGTASGWKLFQFPVGTSPDVIVRAKDTKGNVTKESKTVSL